MMYVLEADISTWPKPARSGRPLTFNDCADCTGRLVIHFRYLDSEKSYENKYVNIPLFLAEFSSFLASVCESKPTRWYLGFAPFAFGQLSNGSLLISSRSGNSFSKSIYDASLGSNVSKLKMQVAKDIKKFGSIELAESSISRLVDF